MSEKSEYRYGRLPEPKRQPAPTLTISDMLEIARKIDQQTGHYLSYGEISTGIYAGRINPDDYLKKRKRRGRKDTKHQGGDMEAKPEKAEG